MHQPNSIEEHVREANYEQISIEVFGMTVLHAKGDKKVTDVEISNRRQVDVFALATVPHSLELSTDRRVLEKLIN